ncbi:uncharacterized protein LOC126882272 [Diabrotica virgifera virgifera]|uniref:Uncharacterized protein n=1 Tax=Diabrotica virgifera virgifera TaxID=50390 RepID=A0ABM5JYR4_DIAVI|nr:uncharacterized protein LOC126882272 [Diabrotica virgifera virgifera]
MGSKDLIASVLVLVGYISSQAESNKLELNSSMTLVTCMEEAGMTFDQFKEQLKSNGHDALCVLKCSYEKTGALDKDGNVDPGVLWAHLVKHGLDDTPNIKNKFTECMKSAGKILTCDDAVKFASCFDDIFNF